jgi:hypothetical protein
MESFRVFWENRNPLSRLYHKTSVKSLINILGSGEFKLVAANSAFERFIIDRRAKKTSYNTEPIYNYKKNYYFSAARSMYNSYYMSGNHYRRPFVVIELDSSKLADKYEIIPVDYWHVSRTPSTEFKDETEDRVITSKPRIDNATKYITRIFVYAGEENELDRKSVDIMSNSGLPVYLFRNLNDLYLRNIKKAERIEGHNQEAAPRELYVPENDEGKHKKIKELNDIYNFITDPTMENREKIKHPISSADELVYNSSHSKVDEIKDTVFQFQELQRKTNKSIRSLLIKAIEEFDKRYNK